MKNLRTIVLGSAIAAATAIASLPSVAGGEPAKSVNDGVYSWDQSIRGEEAYQTSCAAGCHLADMTGSERAPSLAGDSFMLRWNGQKLGDLFLRIQMTMPQTAPHSLSDETYADIVAYILSANGLPMGDDDLQPNVDALKDVNFIYER